MSSNDKFEKTSIIPSDTFSGRIKAASDAPPSIVVLMGPQGYVGRQWSLTQKELIIGRAVESQIYIDDKSVSRSHARLNVINGEVTIMDLDSSNKTIVNGQMLAPMSPFQLKNNDQIKTGNVIFKFLEKGSIEAVTNLELNEKATKDALTGAHSKGALLERGPEVIKRSEFLNEDLSIVVFDIDHFKKINDQYGHPAGDYVLKELSRIVMAKIIRSHDFFARYGGEEFVVILSGSGKSSSLDVAERLRQNIEAFEFVFNGTKIPVTISLGVAIRKANENNWDLLFKRADDALYQAKKTGRNRVFLAP
jgi:two-component system cell cycle response regulator